LIRLLNISFILLNGKILEKNVQINMESKYIHEIYPL
jgi:hypothetical protein